MHSNPLKLHSRQTVINPLQNLAIWQGVFFVENWYKAMATGDTIKKGSLNVMMHFSQTIETIGIAGVADKAILPV
jgi:hypothetical protein